MYGLSVRCPAAILDIDIMLKSMSATLNPKTQTLNRPHLGQAGAQLRDLMLTQRLRRRILRLCDFPRIPQLHCFPLQTVGTLQRRLSSGAGGGMCRSRICCASPSTGSWLPEGHSPRGASRRLRSCSLAGAGDVAACAGCGHGSINARPGGCRPIRQVHASRL